MQDTLNPVLPPLNWETDYVCRRVLEVTCKSFGYSPQRVTLETCLGEEIAGDSLDIVEYIMALEEAFEVTISDDVAQQFFPRQPIRLGHIVDMILALQRDPHSTRPDRSLPASMAVHVEAVSCTQQGGKLRADKWMQGPLFEPLGVNREGYPQYLRCTDGMRCVLVPEGEARIGSTDDDDLPVERPAHTVRLSPFLIDAEPVSSRAFARFLNSVGPVPPAILREWCLAGSGDRREKLFPLRRGWWPGWSALGRCETKPVVLVTWSGANAYSLWANRRDWRLYRGDGSMPAELRDRAVIAPAPPVTWLDSLLPSEAQWEYAGRGPDGRRYPWGDLPPAPYLLRADCHRKGVRYTASTMPMARVSQRLGMSPFGLHHMAGNVWQWCRDWYDPHFYTRSEAGDPDAQNCRRTGIRSERGGSWVGPARLARLSYRRGRPPTVCGRCLGFRCVGLAADL
jgi:acyl carrier protein